MADQPMFVRGRDGVRHSMREVVTRRDSDGGTLVFGAHVNRVTTLQSQLHSDEITELIYHSPTGEEDPVLLAARPWHYDPWSGHVVIADDPPRPVCFVDEAQGEGESSSSSARSSRRHPLSIPPRAPGRS